MSKQLFIIAGPNGSGKTTLAKEFLKEITLDFLNADEIAYTINGQNINSVRVRAGKQLIKKLQQSIDENKSFAIESTLSGNYLLKYISKAKLSGYKITLIYFYVDNPEVCIERIKTRVKNGGHHVPSEDVRRRFYRSKNNFWNKYLSLLDKWFIIYNGIEKPILVAIGQKKCFEITDEALFKNFTKDIDNG